LGPSNSISGKVHLGIEGQVPQKEAAEASRFGGGISRQPGLSRKKITVIDAARFEVMPMVDILSSPKPFKTLTRHAARTHQVFLQKSLPCLTCHSQSQTSNAMLKKPAMQIPPESLTVVALKLNSRSGAGTLSEISAKVLT